MKKTMYLLVLCTTCAIMGCNESITSADFSEEIEVERSSRRAEKVDVCHKGNVIGLSENAVNGHLSHGDVLLVPDEDGYYPPNECGYETRPECNINYLSDFDGAPVRNDLGLTISSSPECNEMGFGFPGNGLGLSPGCNVFSGSLATEELSQLSFDLAAISDGQINDEGEELRVAIFSNSSGGVLTIKYDISSDPWLYDDAKAENLCISYNTLATSPLIITGDRINKVQIIDIPISSSLFITFGFRSQTTQTEERWAIDNIHLTCSADCPL
ncbi:MAG: hypothetical protein KJP00_01425 [Bacteroidia bacterium]|nr:hypothetical protein [Bacteroidia bacterium]